MRPVRVVVLVETDPTCVQWCGTCLLVFTWCSSSSSSAPSQRRRPAPKVEMGTTSHNDVDLSWIPQETLNQISTYTLQTRSPLTSDP